MATREFRQDALPASDAPTDGDLDFRAVGRELRRKKWWLLIPVAVVALTSFAIVNTLTPRYKSEARIILEGRENVFLRPEVDRNGDRERATLDAEAVTSQVQLALSREVARQVIKQLKLGERPEFDPVLRGVGPLRQILILLGISRDPLRSTPEERVFESYYERVQAFPVDKSRVIAIEFQSIDPDLAARGANAIAEAYVLQLQIVKQEQTKAANQWLAGEIETLRARVAEAEAKVDQFRTKSNLFMGPNNNSLSNQTLGEVASQLAAARAQQAEIDAKVQGIRAMLRAGRPLESGEFVNSELIRRLNEQRVTLRAQLAEQSSTLLGNHPRIKELRAQISDLERQIRAEAERVVRALENDARIAGGRVEQLSRNLELFKRQAASTGEQEVQLRALEREAKAQRDLLESYLAKYRETTARESLGATPSDARIISRAIVSNTPYFPRKLPIVLIASLATLALGAGFIITGELLAGNVYRPGNIYRPDGVVALAPGSDARAPVVSARTDGRGGSPATDAQSLAGMAAALAGQNNERMRIAIVGLSPDAFTGGATHALARELAADGRTVTVDLDFSGSPAAGTPPNKGLADLVRGKASFGEIISRGGAAGLHAIAAGDSAGDAGAILASERLAIALDALQRAYNYVLIDLGAMPVIEDERLARLAPYVVLYSPAPMPEAMRAAEESLRAAGCQEVLALNGAFAAASENAAAA